MFYNNSKKHTKAKLFFILQRNFEINKLLNKEKSNILIELAKIINTNSNIITYLNRYLVQIDARFQAYIANF